jgi:hypothetical protein
MHRSNRSRKLRYVDTSISNLKSLEGTTPPPTPTRALGPARSAANTSCERHGGDLILHHLRRRAPIANFRAARGGGPRGRRRP